MRPEEITVEVRDINLRRRGKITTNYLDLQARRVDLGVGSWTLKLPREHPMSAVLEEPGSGIIIRVRDQVFLSGPMVKPASDATPTDPQGKFIFSGVDDNILLMDAQAWPQPSNPNVDTQTESHDVRTGDAETVLKGYVNANIGPGAPLARRGLLAQKLIIEPNENRGATVVRSARFPKLNELLAGIALYAGLGYRIVQQGTNLVFQVYQVRDRTRFVRFSVANGSLSEESVEVSPPEITRAIVAGQGEMVDRQFIMRTTAEAQAAEQEWGRVIEEFIDQRQTDDPLELEQAGDERLIEAGFTATSVKAVPSEVTMRYLEDWDLGDSVTVLIKGQEPSARVTEVALVANSTGCGIGAALGDVRGFTRTSSLEKRVEDTQRRLAALEKNVGTGEKLDLPLAVSQGGTGGTTPATARAGLGIPAWSTQNDFSTLVQRMSNGQVYFSDPTTRASGATKGYVDDAIAGAHQISPLSSTAGMSSYPVGLSIMDASSGTWPDSIGTVLTVHLTIHRAWQIFSNKASDSWLRSWNSSSWSPWFKLGGPDLPSQVVSTGASTNIITATSWATIPNQNVNHHFVVPSGRKLLVDIEAGGWCVKPEGNDLRFSILADGATSMPATWPSWGAVGWAGVNARYDGGLFITRKLELNAGTTTISLVAYKSGSDQVNLNYPSLVITPVRWTQ